MLQFIEEINSEIQIHSILQQMEGSEPFVEGGEKYKRGHVCRIRDMRTAMENPPCSRLASSGTLSEHGPIHKKACKRFGPSDAALAI